MIKKKITIINKLGVHARAAIKLVNTASRFSSEILITFNHKTMNAKSVMNVMVLAAAKGAVLEVSTEGSDEQAAMDAVEQLINNRFDEAE